jgi:hypothetical protein
VYFAADKSEISMGAAAAGAAGASIAGAGLSAYSQVLAAKGVAAGDNYKAASLENAAARGRVAAVQTGASATERLAADLGNIDAVRAAAHADPTSPTSAAVRDLNETLGITNKTIAVDNIMAQSAQEGSDAAYLRSASKYALLAGELGAGATLLGGVGQGLTALGKPASVVPKDYDPNQLSSLY